MQTFRRARPAMAGLMACLMATTACTSMERATQQTREAALAADEARTGPSLRERPVRPGVTSPNAFIAGDPVQPNARRTLPAAFKQTFDYSEELPTRLASVIEMVNSRTGIAVKANPDALSFADRTNETPRLDVISLLGPEYGAPAPSGGSASGLVLPGAPSAPPGNRPGAAASANSGSSGRGAVFRYTGNLEGFLDNVAARFGISWQFEKDEIVFYRFATKIFTLNSIAAETVDVDVNVTQSTKSGESSSGGGGASGASGGSGSSSRANNGNSDALTTTNMARFQSKVQLWQEIKANVERLLSPDGQIAVSPGLSTITVSDTPERVSMVGRYLEQENERLGRQVSVDLVIYAVQLDRQDGYGVDWNTVFSVLGKDFGLSVATAAGGAATAASRLAAGVVFDAVQSAAGATGGTTGSSGSSGEATVSRNQAFFRALSTQGTVSVVHEHTVTAPNGQPAILRNAKESDYVAGYNRDTTTTGGISGSTGSVTVTPDIQQAVDSFTFLILPRILDGRRLLLQFSLSIEELLGMRSQTSQNGDFQLRDVNRRNLAQRVNLRSGQTMMIASSQTENAKDQRTGTFDPLLPLLGGSRDTRRARTVFVVVMTPQIADGL